MDVQLTKSDFTTETVRPELCLRVAENRYGSTGSPRTETVVLFHFLKCICRGKSHFPCDNVLIFGLISFAPTRPKFKIHL
ncbi:hypothetical protein [Moraxella lacunata]|uniref:hypothetical protein n=1 Tax=Moraxella lacunata TaxID=477 RepID=UPI003EDF9E3F